MKTLDILSTIGALVLAATPLAVAGAAHAAPTSAVIPVADLDFANRADVARFDARVAHVADSLCGEVGGRDLSRLQTCREAVREEAVDQLGAEQRQAMASGQAVNWRLAAR